MKQTLQHKILGVLFTLVVLFPFGLQALHALDNHEHVVCTAKDVKHFHAEELDCCLCCTPVELNTLLFSFNSNLVNPTEYFDDYKVVTQITTLNLFDLKSPRGPPALS